MNVRRGWFAVLCAMLIAAPTFAKDPVATECPAMAIEDLVSCSNCCPWLQGAFAKTAGSQAGKWLVAVAKPAKKTASAEAQATPLATKATKTMVTRVLPRRPSPDSTSEQKQIIANLEILRSDATGEWKTICRPRIATLAGRPATMAFMQFPGQLMRVKLDMQVAKEADKSTPAQLLAKMIIEEVDEDGVAKTIARPQIIAMEDQEAEIAMARKDGVLKVKLRMAEMPVEQATGKVYPNPIAPPQPKVVKNSAAPPLPRAVLPRPLPPAAKAWAPKRQNTESSQRLIMAKVKIDEQAEGGQWVTISRPQLVAIEGHEAKIEVGEQHGERLALAMNMTCLPVASPSKDAVQQLLAKMRLTRVDGNGKRTVFAEPQLIAIENQKCEIAVQSADGRAIKVGVTMQEIGKEVLAENAWNKTPSYADTAPQAVSSLQQPAGFTAGVQVPMELVGSQADPRTTDLARTPPTRPAAQPTPRSLTSWITTAPSVTAAAPLAPHPPAVVQPRSTPVTANIASDDATDAYFTQKMKYEEHYQNKLTQLLSHIPQATVAVDVQLSASSQPDQVRVAVTFPDNYIEQLWESQRISDAPATAEELVALLDEVKASVGELAAAVLPPGVNGETSVVIQAYTDVAPYQRVAQTAAAPQIVYASPASSSAFDFAPWMLGVIAITLLCASIGAAVLFRRAPTPQPQEHAAESLPRPPRRRAA